MISLVEGLLDIGKLTCAKTYTGNYQTEKGRMVGSVMVIYSYMSVLSIYSTTKTKTNPCV